MLNNSSQIIEIEGDNDGCYTLYDGSIKSRTHSIMSAQFPIKKLFDPTFLKTQQLVNKIAQGRGETIFFSIDNTPLVLRHYHRGGVVAKVSRDYYLWLGLKQTRAYRELAMLFHLSSNNLPAPKPFAARVIREGYRYRADIITHAITDTETLSQRLQNSTIDNTLWRKIGEIITNFHKKGIYHADLNAHNIMLDSNDDVFIIDFDKARLKDPTNVPWREHNLQRLQRSLVKLKRSSTVFYFSDKNWTQLEQSYRSRF